MPRCHCPFKTEAYCTGLHGCCRSRTAPTAISVVPFDCCGNISDSLYGSLHQNLPQLYHAAMDKPDTSHLRQQRRLPPCPCLGASEKFQDKFTFSPYVKSVPYQRKIIVPLQKQRGLVLNLLCCTTGTMYGCTVIMNRLT